MITDSHRGPGFGVYVHWPFCESKCPYCDFNSHVSESIDHARWRQAYTTEIQWAAQAVGASKEARPTVTSIFFGGGTPSLMPPETAHAVLQSISREFPVHGDVEITLEANPSSVEVKRFQGYRDAGVNRVSVGVQSFDDNALTFLGRRHTGAAARRALEVAATIFPRFSFDLIYALPNQTPAQWKSELEQALAFGSEHLSVYQLTIETGTPFARNGANAASEEAAEALFHLSNEVLENAGLPAYEISNHARSGSACQHNLLYWRSGEHIGIGPGAHGRLRRENSRWQAHYRIHTPSRWLDSVDTNCHGTAKTVPISASERIDEAILMGLRLREGLSRDDFELATSQTFESALKAANLSTLIDGGFVVLDKACLRATPEGWQRLDAVIARLMS